LERSYEPGDGHAALAVAHHRLRTGTVKQPKLGWMVCGDMLADILRSALTDSGLREIDLVRAGGVLPRYEARWVYALRQLLRGEERSFVWVQRWSKLLGVDLDALGASVHSRRS
jgi:hypothetical protein